MPPNVSVMAPAFMPVPLKQYRCVSELKNAEWNFLMLTGILKQMFREFIAGELGGMGLIKNAVEQGRQAVENIAKSVKKDHAASYDLIIIGAGPAGISGSLAARKHNLKFSVA